MREELPSWLSAFAQVVVKYGLTGAIAAYLVWVGATNIPELRLEMAAQRREIQQLQVTLQEIRHQGEELKLIAQWICSNTAKSEAAARACFQP